MTRKLYFIRGKNKIKQIYGIAPPKPVTADTTITKSDTTNITADAA